MKIVYKWKTLFVFLLIVGFAKTTLAQQKFEKAEFYKVMDSGDLTAINSQIEIVQGSSSPYKEGYEGALLMRKAGKVPVPAQKLKFFKAGRIKLETAMLADNDNTEYHFLRLAIEEHAPKIVKYHFDIENLHYDTNLRPLNQHMGTAPLREACLCRIFISIWY